MLNETHDVNLQSWIGSANTHSDFPIQNLPVAVFRRAGSQEMFRGGVAIGDQVVDLSLLAQTSVLSGDALQACQAGAQTKLNALMAMGASYNSALRLSLSRALRADSKEKETVQTCLIAQTDIEFDMPCVIGDYTDFYSSIHHAKAVGALFRPEQPLLPNYQWLPIGYHGRSSSICLSGADFHRPVGQRKSSDQQQPQFGPSERLDYELELGIYIGQENHLGVPIDISVAEEHIFGFCLFNDWSARDIQAWEYQPLGPFLGKNFSSTISPWIVTHEALAPYRVAFTRGEDEPQPLDYLSSDLNSQQGSIDIQLQCFIQSAQMRETKLAPTKISTTSFKHCYWTAAQMVTHHTVNGCNLQAGDLLATGTQSGPRPEEAGSLLELSEGGKKTISLPNGEQRTFLQDGDEVIMRAHCEKEGAAKIGFGEVVARVLPALDRR